jgi:hypothetical protein
MGLDFAYWVDAVVSPLVLTVKKFRKRSLLPLMVALFSFCAVAQVSISPTSLSFGTDAIGNSVTKTVTLTNNATSALKLNSIGSTNGDFWGAFGTCGTSLAAHRKCTIKVEFAPSILGADTGVLKIFDSGKNSPQQISLSGIGVTPVTLTPASLSFANQAVGTTSASKTITLKNSLSTALTIAQIAVSADFAILSATTCSTSHKLAAKSQCTIEVAFHPSAQGTRTGSLSVANASAAPYNNLSASLTGIGTATLKSISVAPSASSISQGATRQFTATGTYSDRTTKDLTTTVTWTSSSTAVASITTGGLVGGVASGKATIKAASGTVSGSTALSVTPRALMSIAVTPANSTIPLGTTQQFAATGTYSDGSTQNLTSTVVWGSSASSVATVSSTGFGISHAAGPVTITATSGAVSGQTMLTVSPAAPISITVTPTSASIPLGTTQQFTASGTFTDGSVQDVTGVVTWSCTAHSVATVNATGLAGTLSTGPTNITASLGSIVSNSASLTVLPAVLQSIAITPANTTIALGTTQQLVATGIFSDGSTQDLTSTVDWSSSDNTVAAVSTAGLASSVATGTVAIFAASGSATGSTGLCISPAQLVSIAITPAIPSIPLGTTQQFTATGTFTDNSTQDLTATLHWSSTDGTIATISNSIGTNGLASSVATGTVTISAFSSTVSGSTSLTVTQAALVSIAVTPPSPSIALGTTQQLTATGTYTDSTTQVLTSTATWASTATTVATVDVTGLAHTAATGNTAVSACVGNISGTTILTVTPATLVSITVAPSSPSIPLGTTQQFTATGNYTDSSTQDSTSSVHWSTSDGTVATISNSSPTSGLAASVSVASVSVTATSGTVFGTASLTITPAQLVSISVTPQNPAIPLGSSQQFTATGTYTDQTTKDITTNVTWSSTAATVAVASNNTGSRGLAVSSGVGSATIAATMSAISAGTSLIVGPPQLVSIAVTPANPTIPFGTGQQFTATGTYTDNSTANLTNSVIWGSTNTSVATIGTSGSITMVSQGQTTITATAGATVGSTPLTVGAPQLVSISVTPTNPTISVGSGQQFTATGTYTDSSTANLTNSVIWGSTNTGVATIGPSGSITTVSQGQTTISATSCDLTVGSTTTLTVSAPAQSTRTNVMMTLVLDHSNSMNLNGGAQALPPAVITFLSYFSDTLDQAAVSSFGSSGALNVAMEHPFVNDITNFVNGLQFTGGTYAQGGLDNAANVLCGWAVPASWPYGGGCPVVANTTKVVVFFTDGWANTNYDALNTQPGGGGCPATPVYYGGCAWPEAQMGWCSGPAQPPYTFVWDSRGNNVFGCTPSAFPTHMPGNPGTLNSQQDGETNVPNEAMYRAMSWANAMRAQGVIVYTVGLGDKINLPFLEQMANDPSGTAFEGFSYNSATPQGIAVFAGDCPGPSCSSELNQAFQTVANNILLKITQ